MRPTPAEVISGVRRILADVIDPEIRSEYARARLREVRAVLAQLDWDNAGLGMQSDVARMRQLLGEFSRWATAEPARSRHFAPYTAQLGTMIASETDAGSDFSACNSRKAEQDQVVIGLIDPLEDWITAHPADADGRELRRRLLDLYQPR